MSALEETAAATVGKSTQQDSSQLSVGDATQATLPQLRYADAIHAALRAIEVLPDLVDAGVRTETVDGQRELYIRLQWMPLHDDLVPHTVRADGLTVQWSHLAGWSVCSGEDVTALEGADDLADPAVIADACLHAAIHGPRCTCDRPDPAARWSKAVYLDIALVAYDERIEG